MVCGQLRWVAPVADRDGALELETQPQKMGKHHSYRQSNPALAMERIHEGRELADGGQQRSLLRMANELQGPERRLQRDREDESF